MTDDTTLGTDAAPAAAADGDREPSDGSDEARHGARAALYGAVAGAFVYPDADQLAALTDPEAVDALRTAGDRLGLDDVVASFVAALQATDADGLARAYDRLFGLPDGGRYPVVPYEAAHTVAGDIGQKQRRVAAVAGLMERLGVEPGESFDERQDHVAAELELLQVLAGRRAVAAADGDRTAADRTRTAEATVVHEHVADFVPSLAAAIREAADPDDDGEVAYVAAASLAEALVERDARRYDPPAIGTGDDADDRAAANRGGNR